jgi:hypothetical protein
MKGSPSLGQDLRDIRELKAWISQVDERLEETRCIAETLCRRILKPSCSGSRIGDVFRLDAAF